MIDKISTMVTDTLSAEDIENGVPWKDVIAVVRCKDCKHYIGNGHMEWCNLSHGNHEDNWYCADGERR